MKVAVAGGGPAGMTLALLLARAGIEVTVFEKHRDFLRDFRGDTVHPSTLTLLDDLGLGEAFAALPHTRVSRVEFPLADGRSVAVADFSRLPLRHPYIAMVPQWDLLDLLAEAGAAEPSYTLRMSTEVTDLIREGDRVCGVRYRGPDGDGELRADLTVACDGRWSVLRRASELPSIDVPVGVDAWWFKVPTRQPTARSLLPRPARGGVFIAIPRRDYYQIALIGPKGDDARLRARGIEDLRRRVTEAFPDLAADVAGLASMDDVKHLVVRIDRLRRWYADGLFVIGDAAHAMSPLGGVGVNLAVQDAVAAATVLASRARSGVRPADLARVQRRRMVPTVLTQGLQRLMHRRVVDPSIAGRTIGPPPLVVALLRRVPALGAVPAFLVGVGVRPERAPEFARRARGSLQRVGDGHVTQVAG